MEEKFETFGGNNIKRNIIRHIFGNSIYLTDYISAHEKPSSAVIQHPDGSKPR